MCDSDKEALEESKCNYESYRILVQNECAGGTERLDFTVLFLYSVYFNLFLFWFLESL